MQISSAEMQLLEHAGVRLDTVPPARQRRRQAGKPWALLPPSRAALLQGDGKGADKKPGNAAAFAQPPNHPRWDLEDAHVGIGAVPGPGIWDGTREGGARLGGGL